tara:strand:- start:3964 stop:4743 length:780 start_codon:yes stop_codon:yes gene_type:complete
MKRLKIFLLSFVVCLQTAHAGDDWGKTGHRVTGEIAQKYLSKKAQREIDKLLKGTSLAFVANYGDDIKSDNAYRSYYPWHYVNFPFDSTYELHPKSKKGDLIQGIYTCIEFLKSDTSTEAEKIFHLKMLVHFMGDLHQPLHVGLSEDKGGNDHDVRWFKKRTNLHVVWDTSMIEDYNMSYTELAANASKLSALQLQQYQNGTVIDWMYDSRELCKEIYENIEVGDALGYRYMYDNFNVVRSQLQKGGIRLAVLLNDIFG